MSRGRRGTGERLKQLSTALGLGDDPGRILAPLRELYAEVDAGLRSATAELDLPCRAGCSDCCYEAVFVSAAEFLAVAEALFERDEAGQEPTLDAVLRLMCTVAGHFADEIELLETLPPGPERDEVAARVRFRCPLLGPDERCSVYAVRELNARSFGQTMDARRGSPYGCERTHARLKVLGPVPLADARELRAQLVRSVPGTDFVHIYPYWFSRYRELLI